MRVESEMTQGRAQNGVLQGEGIFSSELRAIVHQSQFQTSQLLKTLYLNRINLTQG